MRPSLRATTALAALAAACTDQPFTVDIPLRVVSIQPGGNAVDVRREAKVALVFSEELDPASVGMPKLTFADGEVPADAAYDPATSTLTLTPKGKLDYSRGYTVIVPSTVARKRDKGRIPFEVKSDFRTSDPPPLHVVAVRPADGASGVPRTQVVQVTFSEPVKCDSFRAATTLLEAKDKHRHFGGAEAAVPGTWTCAEPSGADQLEGTACGTDASLCTVTFVPSASGFKFGWSSHLTLTIKGGSRADGAVESFRATPSGGQLASTVVSASHVVDPPALVMVQSVPGDQATGLARAGAIEMHFNEPVDCDAASDLITVQETLDPLPVARNEGKPLVSDPGGELTCVRSSGEATCATAPASCVLTYAIAGATVPVYDWSADVEITLPGGGYTADAAVAASTSVESIRATSHAGSLAATQTITLRAEDPPPLSLVEAFPGNGSVNVPRRPLDGIITLTFSEPPDCDSVVDNVEVIESFFDQVAPRTVTGNWICPVTIASVVQPTAIFEPDDDDSDLKPFSYSSLVKVTLPGGSYQPREAVVSNIYVQSTRATTLGGQLPANTTVTIAIEDPPPLLVAAVDPGAGSTGVRKDSSIKLRFASIPGLEFSEWGGIDCSTLTAALEVEETPDVGGVQTVLGALTCSDGDTEVTFEPTSDFGFSSTIAVHIDGGVRPDAAETAFATDYGGQLPRDFEATFRVEDPPPLLITGTRPSASGVEVDRTAPIDVFFSQPLACVSVLGHFTVQENFAIPEGTDQAPAPAAVTCTFACPLVVGSNTDLAAVRCDHAPFAQSSVVQVTLAGGATSAASIRSQSATSTGGYLHAPPMVLSFRAQDPAPLTLIANEPNGQPGVRVSANTEVRLTFDRAVRCATALTRVSLVDTSAGSEVVPGTVTCAGPVVTFKPQSALTVEHLYEATASAGIAAADATVVSGVVKGQLEQNASFRFRVAHEDLQVVSTTPAGGASLVTIGTQITVGFNQQIAFGSLVPCDAAASTDGCNMWINPGSLPDVTKRISLQKVSYDNVNFVARLDPGESSTDPFLKPNVTYTVQILAGGAGPLGSNGVSRMPTDYTWTFSTSSTTLVAGVEPPNGTTGVNVSAPVCVEFVGSVTVDSLTDGGADQITLSYEDEFKRIVQVPLDPAVPYTISGGSSNLVCLNILEAPTPCFPGKRRLLYDTDYTGTISTTVDVGGQNLTEPFTWSFTTRQPPEISEVRKLNAVVDEPLADGDQEVPVNATFQIRFAEVMSADTLTEAGNIAVVPLDGSIAVTATVTLDDAANPLEAMVSVSPSMDHLAAGKGSYALQLLGGAGGVSTKAGNYLDEDVRYRFTTSPATSLVISPPELKVSPAVIVPVISNRDLYLPSVSAQSLFATKEGSLISGIIAQQALQPRAVSYIANPTYDDDSTSNDGYKIGTTTAILDLRGNPVPPVSSKTYGTFNTSSLASHPPATRTQTAIARIGPQTFLFTLAPPAGGNDVDQRMLGSSYYSAPLGQSDPGNISLEGPTAAGCTSPARLPLRISYLVGSLGTSQADADSVRIEVAGPPYMRSTCVYTLRIRQAQTANLYDLAPATTGCTGTGVFTTDIISNTACLTAGQASPGMTFTGENSPPALAELQVQRLNGTFGDAATVTDASGGSVIRATFSEAIDPATVSEATFSINDGSTGTYQVVGNVVTLTPRVHLNAGQTYTVTFAANGVKDLAGNAYVPPALAPSFTVESAVPTISFKSFSDAYPTREAPFGTLVLDFTEDVNPSTITVDTSTTGSISVDADGVQQFGCAVRDPSDAKRILWRPAAAIAQNAILTIKINSAAAKLTDMAGTEVTAVSQNMLRP